MAKKILERLIDRLGQKSKRYQSGGRYRGYDKAAAFGLKALKAIPRVATFSGSKLLGIPAMMLGSQKAYGATVYDEHGVNKYTGEKRYQSFDSPPPESWQDREKQTPMEISSLDIPRDYQKGGMKEIFQRGGLPGRKMPIWANDYFEDDTSFYNATSDEKSDAFKAFNKTRDKSKTKSTSFYGNLSEEQQADYDRMDDLYQQVAYDIGQKAGYKKGQTPYKYKAKMYMGPWRRYHEGKGKREYYEDNPEAAASVRLVDKLANLSDDDQRGIAKIASKIGSEFVETDSWLGALRKAASIDLSGLKQYREKMGYSKDDLIKEIFDIGGDSVKKYNNLALRKLLATKDFKTGGMMDAIKRYQEGGPIQELPGGTMEQIPGTDAVEFSGNKHDESGMGSESGIELDPQTEVEDGETMDQVTVAQKGGLGNKRNNYFFSSHLKKGGKSFADMHKDILQEGGEQKDVDWLAKMQEKAAGRNPDKIGAFKGGGFRSRYQQGGVVNTKKDALAQENTYEIDGVVYNLDGDVLWSDVDGDNINDRDQGTTYRTQEAENKMAEFTSNQIKTIEARTNSKFDIKTNTFLREDGSEVPANEISDVNITDINPSNTLQNQNQQKQNENVQNEKDNKSSESTLENLTVASEDYLPEYGDIPGYQGGKNIGGSQYYLQDPELEKYIGDHDDFGAEWMQNVDPEVLKEANITSYADLQDPDKVTAYQNAWNKLHPDNQIQVDGKFGEQTIRTGLKKAEDDNTKDVDIDKTDEDETNGTTDITINEKDKKKKKDWLGKMAQIAQFIPAAAAYMEGADYMSPPDMVSPGAVVAGNIPKTHLDRVDYNDQLARNSADARAMDRFIETSGGGPANMMNKMAAYAAKQKGDLTIKANEERANAAIRNQEAALDAQRNQTNIANALDASKFNVQQGQSAAQFNAKAKMTVDEFNRGADAAVSDRRLMALDSAVKTWAGMRKDKLQYDAQERLAQAISGQTGVYDAEKYSRELIDAGYNVGDQDYKDMMAAYNKVYRPKITPKAKTSSYEEDSKAATDAKKRGGGFYYKMKNYGK